MPSLAWHSACTVLLYAVLIVCVAVPFGVWCSMWNSIVSVSNNCLFIYFSWTIFDFSKCSLRFVRFELDFRMRWNRTALHAPSRSGHVYDTKTKTYLLKRYLPIVPDPFLEFIACIHISRTLLKQHYPRSCSSLKYSQCYLGSKYRQSPSTCIYYLPHFSPSFTHHQGVNHTLPCMPTYSYPSLPYPW